ncbi:MAG: hypothetical protein IMY74_01080 [Bacteroidetes bacterium]|nr:hypothetical protein [Bacteroidota bacterium]
MLKKIGGVLIFQAQLWALAHVKWTIQELRKQYIVSSINRGGLEMIFTRKILAILVVFSLVFCASVTSWAETHTARSCSLTDVTATYNAASAGDTVAIPAGDCLWSSSLKINKAITLQGAGG